MSRARLAGSFRDPSGFLFWHHGVIYRQVGNGFRAAYDQMVESGFFRSAVEAGELLDHQEVEPTDLPVEGNVYKVLRPEQLGFISYPYEWSFSQLKDAALLTLALHQRALQFGLWLKDASAYNVQFRDARPVFIDTLSFETYPEGQPWIAYQQFCKHFLAPLLLMARRHVDLNRLLRGFIDGIPLEMASRLLPGVSWLSPAPLMHVHLHARSLRAYADRPEAAARKRIRLVSRTGMLGLVDNLESAIRRLDWKPQGTEWVNYYENTNYSEEALENKKSIVREFLDKSRPGSVWDFGANTGVFSRLASERGIPTVSFDMDPAAVEKNYRQIRDAGETHLLPLLMDLTNPSPSLGWDFSERMSLRARGPCDLAMALALVHHLAIGNNVPLGRIAEFFHGVCRSLIIEFVPKSDSQVERLLASRQDIFPGYTRQGFEGAFASYFEQQMCAPVSGSERMLYLFEGK
jgi:ribosomal protein L11 methylase PrmA